MDKITSESEPSTSSAANPEIESVVSPERMKLPKVLLTRLDEKAILSLKKQASSGSLIKKQRKRTDKSKDVLKISKRENAVSGISRPRGRPKKLNDDFVQVQFKRNNIKPGLKNKSVKTNKKGNEKTAPKASLKVISLGTNKVSRNDNEKSRGRPVSILKKAMLQKRSKVAIPSVKKPKTTSTKAITPKSPTNAKPAPPKPKLEVIHSKMGENSSDTSGDEFLYDELIEELENTAKKQTFVAKQVIEKTTITLKPNVGNKPPTVLKGGIVKRTDLPSDLNLIASSVKTNSNIVSNGLQKKNTPVVPAPRGKKRNLDTVERSSPAKKPSPWPVTLAPSPKKAQITNTNKKKPDVPESRVSQADEKQTLKPSPKNGPPPLSLSDVVPSEPSFKPRSITIETPKPRIGPKQTAKVVPLSKSYDVDDNLSDEYLEEETLESELEVVQVSKESQVKSRYDSKANTSPKPPTTKASTDQSLDLELLKILTDESEDHVITKSTETKEKTDAPKTDTASKDRYEVADAQASSEKILDDKVEDVKDKENEEPPVRTIYEVMNEVFLNYPSWNLHIIPETSAFCIAQVTKGRLGLPTLKKCIELDPASYNAKVYIHQYHIKRFDGVYDDEESILALIKEIDSIKA